ncbi:MAG TPA: CBS domain-containing protein [Methylomirabilota bacterium]|jgi:CBS domain-containing protein
MAKKPRTTAHLAADSEVKQRQTPHRSDMAKQPPPGLRGQATAKPRVNRDRDRARDAARRPKKYFVAKQLATAESPGRPTLPLRRRPAIVPGRAPRMDRDVIVRDVMVEDVVTIEGSTTLIDAARRMRDANVGMLPVIVDGRLHGVVTDRDLVIRAVAEGMDPGMTAVSELLSERVITGRPEWTIDQAITTMANAQIGRLPVVDDGGGVLGVVTLSSLVLRSRDQKDVLEAAKEVSRRSARREAPRTA